MAKRGQTFSGRRLGFRRSDIQYQELLQRKRNPRITIALKAMEICSMRIER